MSYKEKPQIKLYEYKNNSFVLQAIIDDYQEASFERNLYQAGVFTITINYNIPNSQLFQRGLFVQFGNDKYDFGEIYSIQDTIGEDGKGSQIRTITGYDARYILKRRVIKNTNSNGLWVMTAKGELCLRNLIKDQCGIGAEEKRRLPINNTIPTTENAIGKEYSVSEQFTNLYEVCKTIATQSEIGWRIAFENGELNLEVYAGEDLSQTVRFDTSYESLANGEFSDSSESFTNAIYIGGKGQNDDRDIYEGENESPSGFERFESWDNQSSMTTESEYEAEALSMLTQYGQTIQMAGNGLAKCPYVYKEQYNVGDWITVAFSGKSAVVQILSVTEHWSWGQYDLEFSFGKPQNNLAEQLQLMLRKIQSASNKTNSTDSVRWYTIPTDTEMPKADVTYNTIGFIGSCAEGGSTFKLYLDDEKTGAKTYHVYFKQLGGGKLTLTTGKTGASNLTLNSGTYVAIIYVDENGNVTSQGATATTLIESGSTQPVTSGAVNTALDGKVNTSDVVNVVESGNNNPVTSNAVARNNIHAVRDYWSEDPNNPVDVFAVIESYGDLISSMSEDIKIRIGTYATNSPYGVGVQNCDFYYDIRKVSVSNNNWIRVIAYDVRDNYIYENAKINGTWGIWYQLQRVETTTIFNPIINGVLTCEWSRVEYRNGTYCLYARFYNPTPVAISEGAIIGYVGQGLQPKLGFPINIHNFAVNQDYMMWINETDGAIGLYGVGTQTIAFDMYIETTYVK